MRYFFILLSALALPLAAQAQVNRAEIEGIVKDYITKNPEVVMDAMNAYRTKKMAEEQANAKKAIVDRKKELIDDKSAPSVGAKNADVVVVQFFDYHCGYCKRALPAMQELLDTDKKVRIVFREFPILSEDSTLASKAALAVYSLEPKKYFAYHSALMKAEGKFDLNMLTEEAKKLGLNEDKFKKAMESKEVADEIAKTRELAGALQINGTPAFIVGDELMSGMRDVAEFKEAIKRVRSGGAANSPKS